MAKCDYRVRVNGHAIVGSSAFYIGSKTDHPTLVSEDELHVLVSTYGRDNVTFERDGE